MTDSKPRQRIPSHAVEAVRALVATTALHMWVELAMDQTGKYTALMHSPRPSSGEQGLWEVLRWFAGEDTDLIANAARADADNQRAVEAALLVWVRAGVAV